MSLIRRFGDRLAGPSIGVLFGGLVVVSSFSFFKGQTPQPYEHLVAQVVTETLPVGGPLVVRFSGTRNEICGVTAARAYRDLATRQVVHAEFAPSGFAPLGAWQNEMAIQLPRTMGPGVYAMSSLIVNDCGSRVVPLPFPEVVFRIINQD